MNEQWVGKPAFFTTKDFYAGDTKEVYPFPTTKGPETVTVGLPDPAQLPAQISRVCGGLLTRKHTFKTNVTRGINNTLPGRELSRGISSGEYPDIEEPIKEILTRATSCVSLLLNPMANGMEINFGPTSGTIRSIAREKSISAKDHLLVREVQNDPEYLVYGPFRSPLVEEKAHDGKPMTTVKMATLRCFDYNELPTKKDYNATERRMRKAFKAQDYNLNEAKESFSAMLTRPDALQLCPLPGLNEKNSILSSILVGLWNNLVFDINDGGYFSHKKLDEYGVASMREIVKGLGSLVTIKYTEVKSSWTRKMDGGVRTHEEMANTNIIDTVRTGLILLFNLYRYSPQTESVDEFILNKVKAGALSPQIITVLAPAFAHRANIKDIDPASLEDVPVSAQQFDLVKDVLPKTKEPHTLYEHAKRELEVLNSRTAVEQKARVIKILMDEFYTSLGISNPYTTSDRFREMIDICLEDQYKKLSAKSYTELLALYLNTNEAKTEQKKKRKSPARKVPAEQPTIFSFPVGRTEELVPRITEDPKHHENNPGNNPLFEV